MSCIISSYPFDTVTQVIYHLKHYSHDDSLVTIIRGKKLKDICCSEGQFTKEDQQALPDDLSV